MCPVSKNSRRVPDAQQSLSWAQGSISTDWKGTNSLTEIVGVVRSDLAARQMEYGIDEPRPESWPLAQGRGQESLSEPRHQG